MPAVGTTCVGCGAVNGGPSPTCLLCGAWVMAGDRLCEHLDCQCPGCVDGARPEDLDPDDLCDDCCDARSEWAWEQLSPSEQGRHETNWGRA